MPGPRSRTRPRTRTLVAAAVVLLLVAVAVPTVLLIRDRQRSAQLQRAAEAFAAAWRSGHLETEQFSGGDPAQVARQEATIVAGLAATPSPTQRPGQAQAVRPASVRVVSVERSSDAGGRARLEVRWDLGQGRWWQYRTTAPLIRAGSRWLVAWSPSVVHPQLVAGQVLTTRSIPADRGQILGAGGTVLVTQRPVVVIGIQPGRSTDRRAVAAAVAGVVGVDAASLTQRVLAARSDALVDVITLRRSDYEAVRARLQPIAGVVATESTLSLAPSAGFARALLGTVGPATQELIAPSSGRLRPGDLTGLSGVQRRYDALLAGTAGVTVVAAPTAGPASSGQPPSGTGGPTATLFTVPPVAGRSLRLTIDEKVQLAAEAALAAAPKPAGLVAIRASTGEVLAVANGGPNAAGYDRALIGRYPPGSTFKVATAFALLQAGVSAQTTIPCPASITVDGRAFQNAEGEVLGQALFHTDFAMSCNTAFVGASQRISARQLHDAASALGYGRPNQLGVEAFPGDVPTAAGPVDHAADAIGQGTVLASPLAVASVTASVAAGSYHAPRLVLDPGVATGSATPATPAAQAGSAASTVSAARTNAGLPAGPIATLRALMAEVVTSGTGTALLGAAGGPVHGKTGTAEFGSGNPPPTHAWFTGYQQDVAFAVVVEGGGFGGKVAAPLARSFLDHLA